MLKVSSIKQSFDNWMYVSNHQNSGVNDLTFYGDQRLITGQRIYSANDDIIERMNNCSIANVYMNQI